MGTVTQGGTYPYGYNSIYIYATPNDGYAFLCWQDGGSDNPRQIIPIKDTSIIAYFYPQNSTTDTVLTFDTIILNDTIQVVLAGDTIYAFDTIVINDTVQMAAVTDTLLLQQYIHRTTITNILSQDTTIVEDSLYVNNFLPYPNSFHDTTILTDTVMQYSTIYDTITQITYIHDTTAITDTLTLYADTLTLTEYITDTLTLTDTLMLYADTLTLYDTVTLTMTDTITLYADTLTLTEYITDTLTLTDTLMVYADTLTLFDTVTLTLTDTITLYADTLTLTEYITDTVMLTQIDTLTLYDTITLTDYIHDTVTLTQYDTINTVTYIHDTTTITVTITDTVTQNIYIHDTTTITLTDTIYLTVTDTVFSYDSIVYDTVYVPYYIHDTITINEAVTYYLLSVMSNNQNYGIVAGSGQFPDGAQVEIAAIPLQGYSFVSWSDGSTDNPHTITLNDDSYYIATFAQNTQGINGANNSSWQAYSEIGTIVVKGAQQNEIQIFDELGRLLKTYSSPGDAVRFMVPSSGVYFVRVAGSGAKRVVVIR